MSSAIQVIDTAPSAENHTSLEAHQAQTPGTFFGGNPVLHHHIANASLQVSEDALNNNTAIAVLRGTNAGATNSATSNGHDGPVDMTIPNIDIWVTSEFFVLWSPSAAKGINIPYPLISLHARQQTSLYMQLCLSDLSQTADQDLETLELLLSPPASSTSNPTDAAEALYAAISACADLHPDPDSEDEDQEQESQPGAGGWITAENMHEFLDENGGFREGAAAAGLGAGAGSVRSAGQFEDAEAGDEGVDGEDEHDDTKWRRTG